MPANQAWRKAAEATYARIAGLMFNRVDARSVAVAAGANFASLHMHEPCVRQPLDTVGEIQLLNHHLT